VDTIASPLRLERTPPALHRPAPALGEHTDEVARDGWGATSRRAGTRGMAPESG
jgi:crotonobetainyl-CoA:carnitine CoA-transferase CaiB-like acyl-CoA transferase